MFIIYIDSSSFCYLIILVLGDQSVSLWYYCSLWCQLKYQPPL